VVIFFTVADSWTFRLSAEKQCAQEKDDLQALSGAFKVKLLVRGKEV
jgi:hypothetical protein